MSTIPKYASLPAEHKRRNKTCQVFYSAGGYDFFKVINPEKYASKWLDFVSGLYADIEEGKYKTDGKFHKEHFSEKEIKTGGVT